MRVYCWSYEVHIDLLGLDLEVALTMIVITKAMGRIFISIVVTAT